MKENLSRFLFSSFFGNTGDIIYGSIDRAYRDMMTCRKPLVPEKEKKAKEKLTLEKRLEASDTLYCAIENLLNGKVSDYGNWHKETCNNLRNHYNAETDYLKYGQAQKWVNMTIKYIYYIFTEAEEFLPNEWKNEKVAEVLNSFKNDYHMPIDSYILNEMAKRNINIKPEKAWSNIDNYESYKEYQKEIGDQLPESRLDWEMREWLRLSENVKETEFGSLMTKHKLTEYNNRLKHPRKRIN